MGVVVKLKNPNLLRASMRSLAQLRGKTLTEEIKRNAGIITEYAAKMTPPTRGTGQSRGVINESWNVQKRTGDKAIKRDVAKVFQPLRSLDLLKNVQWAAAVTKMIRRRDIDGLQKFLAEKGVRNQVITEATVEIHNRYRNKRGRVKKSSGPLLVIVAASIKKVLEHQLAGVGLAKSGWLPGLRQLGRPAPPAWITRHSTPGSVTVTNNPLRPKVRVENAIAYGGNFGDLDIAATAIEIRAKTAGRELKEIMRTKLKQGMKANGLGR